MTVTTITSEGSVPLPDEVRDALGLKPGSEVTSNIATAMP